MLLMHLAATRHIGMSIATHDTDVLHLQSGIAVAETAVTVADQSEVIWHLLQQTEGPWKMMLRLFTEPEVSEQGRWEEKL